MPCLGLPLEQAVRGAAELWAAAGAPGQEATNPSQGPFWDWKGESELKAPRGNRFVARVPQPLPQHAGAWWDGGHGTASHGTASRLS